MNEHDAFLQAIRDNPDDDAPRLMYADWLTERGDVRGEFIRIQCELTAMSEQDARWLALTARMNELERRHSRAWLGALPRLEGVDWGVFERGFPSRISVGSVRVYLRHADAIHAAIPAPEVCFPVLTSDTLRELVQSPRASHLRTLAIDSPFVGPEDIRVLAASAHLSGLRSLVLSSHRIGRRGAAALAASCFWTGLLHMELDNADLGDDGLQALTSAERPPALVELSLASNGFTEEVAEILAERMPPRLELLNLRHNGVGTAGAEALLTSPRLGRLAVLDLAYNEVGPLRQKRLAVAAPGALRRLDLRGNRLRGRGARGLASCPRLAGLQELDLTSNEMDDLAVAVLAGSPFLTRLRRLTLGINLIGDVGARAISHNAHWTALDELNLSANQIGDEGVTALLASDVGQNVKSLYLGGNRHGTRTQSAVQRRRTVRVEKQPQ